MKRRIFCLILALSILNLPGCFSSREPKNLAIINSVIYDKADDGTYRVLEEFMKLSSNSGSSGGGGGSEKKAGNYIELSTGPSLRETLTNVELTISKALYGGHNQARLFTEKFAQDENDIDASLDLFTRDHLTDETALLFIVRGNNPENIYAVNLQDAGTVGMFLSSSEQTQPMTSSKAVFKSTLDFIKDYYQDGKEPVMGLVEAQEYQDPSSGASGQSGSSGGGETDSSSENKKYRLVVEGVAVFKGTKLVGYLNGYGAQAYNFLTNNIKTAIITVPFEDGNTILEVADSSCQVKTTVENNEATFDVSIKMKVRVTAQGGEANIYKKEVQAAVEQTFNAQAQVNLLAAIHLVQSEFQSDIFGFGQQVHSQHPKIWKEIKGNWNDIFSRASVSVTVDSSIIQVGQIKDTLHSEEE